VAPSSPPPTTADAYRWSAGGYSAATRSSAIWAFIGQLLGRAWMDERRASYFMFRRSDEAVRRRRRRLAAWAREQILNLGPTLIKVGQLAAARADILPAEVTEELLQLTDKVPAFGWGAAEALLEEAYGRPVAAVFLWFDKTPLAAASLGQVHRAALPDGTEVVVKIQRPALRQLFDLDLDALRAVAHYLQRSKKWGGESRDWVGIYDECRKTLYEEIDYGLELQNGAAFRRNFADLPHVIVPKAYPEYSTKTVLCLQYVPGISMRDAEGMRAAGVDPALVANRNAEVLLKSILEHALFNADPHPGNQVVSPLLGGSIILYDFGMVGRLNPKIKEQLVDILLGVIEKDAQAVMDTLVDLGALVLPADPAPVQRSIQYFLDQVGSRPDRQQTVAAIGEDLYATSRDKPFRLPAASIFLLRALSTIEGVNKALDPNFSFAAVSQPYADKLLRGRRAGGPAGGAASIVRSLADAAITGKPDVLARQLQKSFVGAGASAVSAVSRIESMERTIQKIERGDVKVRTSRGFETERLLEKLCAAQQAQGYLVVSAASSILAAQLYAAGQRPEGTGVAACVAAISGLLYARKSARLNRDPFSTRE
jgi:predicted unusual protein kinase regulating ubiquinone biosynthesis (AarF/ABC1/UbiB family)